MKQSVDLESVVPLAGSLPLRKEGIPKVLGTAQYIDDITMDGMIHGATVRSGIARGRIVSIRFDEADASGTPIDWSAFTIVTAADIPGENTIIHLTKDHPCLAVGYVNHPEEPILLLAHPDKAVLPAAVAAVKVTYEAKPGVFSIEESEQGAALEQEGDDRNVIWRGHGHGGGPNTFKAYLMRKDQQDTPESVWGERRFCRGGRVPDGGARATLY